ncbi:MAG: DNA-formamidopyrimidine glycosylase family protein [Candidatus Thorarchaeota archaeon]
MPELPELEAIASKLTDDLVGLKIRQARVYNHIILYGTTVDEFQNALPGKTFESFRADGKFLLVSLSEEYEIVINPMLTGRIRVARKPRQPIKEDTLAVVIDDRSLWYSDRKKMGRVYLIRNRNYEDVAEFDGRGPSALDSELDFDIFRTRIRHFNGQIKNVLRNQRFIKGIGNAYADEILLFAGILPFRKRSTLSEDEIGKLYNSMREILTRFKAILLKRPLNEIALEKRDFLMIHGKRGGICPLCGNRVSEITANRFKTNYCQTCQK